MPRGEPTGTYVLLMPCDRGHEVVAGRRAAFSLRPGCYLYVGSARGPGGLAARLRHHLRPAERPHWHIDYLRAALTPNQIWLDDSGEGLECRWARALAGAPGTLIASPGFGSSDCDCPSHLLFRPRLPSARWLRRTLGAGRPVPPADYTS